MSPLFNKLLAPRHEHLILNQDLLILEASFGVHRFAAYPENLAQGHDVRAAFPELVGTEWILIDILEGQQQSFELKGVARSSEPSSPLYFDLYVIRCSERADYQNRLFIGFEDSTERMVLKQLLAQQTNEVGLLLSSLVNSKNYIDKIIASMTDVLLVTTQSGLIKTVNQAVETIFGYTQEELINQPITKLITEENFLQKVKTLSPSTPNEFLKNTEVIAKKKNNELIRISFACSAINTEIEGLKNFVYIGRDIIECKCAEVEMIKTIKDARERQEIKSDGVSMASYELPTSLNSIFSAADLLGTYCNQLSDDQKLKHYHCLETTVKQMTTALEDVLLVSKAAAGKLEFNPTPVDLIIFCRDLVEKIQLGIGKNHKITFVYSSLCLNAYLDEKLLTYILSNLLTNAIKYSPQNSTILLDCSCTDGQVNLEIKDEGIGIPPADQERIFELFHRAKNVDDIPGIGLGLAIVQKSVQLHQGRISVNSEVGVGTTFKITLPLNNSSQTP
jgi:PAS domain S-box-containing protein